MTELGGWKSVLLLIRLEGQGLSVGYAGLEGQRSGQKIQDVLMLLRIGSLLSVLAEPRAQSKLEVARKDIAKCER